MLLIIFNQDDNIIIPPLSSICLEASDTDPVVLAASRSKLMAIPAVNFGSIIPISAQRPSGGKIITASASSGNPDPLKANLQKC